MAIRIHDVQSTTHLSPHVNGMVSLYPAIVTAVAAEGFFLQEADANADADDRTSEAIFVVTIPAPVVAVGDMVQVNGRVRENRLSGPDLSETQIDSRVVGGVVTVQSHDNPLPAPIVLGTGGRTPPTSLISSVVGNVESGARMLVLTDAIDFYESLEGMRIQINNAVACGPRSGGLIAVLPDNGAWSSVRTARGGIVRRSSDANPEIVLLDGELLEADLPAVNVGDTFTAPIVGVLTYRASAFHLLVTSLPTRVNNALAAQSLTAPSSTQLTVGTFNLHNFSAGTAKSRTAALALEIVANLAAPDILALEEIQDNDGDVDSDVVDCAATLSRLVAAISSAGGPAYAWRQINPVNFADGGTAGANIRVVLLFRTDRGLLFVDRLSTSNLSTTSTEFVDGAHGLQLTLSPGRLSPAEAEWDDSRKCLAGEFLFRGHRLFVIACHLRSKLGDSPVWGYSQPPTDDSLPQRTAQAALVDDFVADALALDADAKIIVLGDFNDFDFSAAFDELTNLNLLSAALSEAARYSFVEDGNGQLLDNILVSDWLNAHASPSFQIAHINCEFADQASDHDPVRVRLNLS